MSSVQLANFTVISNHDVHYELHDKKGNVRIIDCSIPAYLSACCKKTQDYLRWYSSAENYYARTGVALFNKKSNPYIFPDKAYVKKEYPCES